MSTKKKPKKATALAPATDVAGKWVASIGVEEPKVSVYHANVLAVGRALLSGLGYHPAPAGAMGMGLLAADELVAYSAKVVDGILALPVHESLTPKVLPEGLAAYVAAGPPEVRS